MDESLVFKALSDPVRRRLLELLLARDGRTLVDLASHISLTRFGVMKHLAVLEEAGLVTSSKSGREKRHFLIRDSLAVVLGRWRSKVAEPTAVADDTKQTKMDKAPKKDRESIGPVQEIIGIIDMSGSMSDAASDVRGGYNHYLNELQRDDSCETRVTTCCFDTVREVLDVSTPIAQAQRLSQENYQPRGSTALYDSLALTIDDFDHRLLEAKQASPSDVIVVIFTDGEENSSRHWSREQVKKLIGAKTELGWSFVYLGANHDAWAAASGIGISASNTMNYDTHEVDKTMAYLSESTKGLRKGERGRESLLADQGETAEESFARVKDSLKTYRDDQ
jgi:DNA-binding transcriptional ArsR family regulator/uncharacterized protein YegL